MSRFDPRMIPNVNSAPSVWRTVIASFCINYGLKYAPIIGKVLQLPMTAFKYCYANNSQCHITLKK